MLVPTLTVAENIVLGMEPKRFIIDMRRNFNYENISSKYNLSVNRKPRKRYLGRYETKVEILKFYCE